MIKSTIIGLIILIILDTTFLNLAKNIYLPVVTEKINIYYAFITWLILVLGIQILVLSRTDLNAKKSLLYGFALGLIVYGVYNFTNMAIYSSKWSKTISCVDIVWGSICTACVTYVMYRFSYM